MLILRIWVLVVFVVVYRWRGEDGEEVKAMGLLVVVGKGLLLYPL